MLTDCPILCDGHEQEWRVLGSYLFGTITMTSEYFDPVHQSLLALTESGMGLTLHRHAPTFPAYAHLLRASQSLVIGSHDPQLQSR